MKVSNPIKAALRKYIYSDRDPLTTYLPNLDKNIVIHSQSLTYIDSEYYSGTTSFFLEYAAKFSQTGLVVYLDCSDGITVNRITDVNIENFIHFKPTESSQIKEFFSTKPALFENCLVIIDSYYLLEDELSLPNLSIMLKGMVKNVTLLVNCMNDKFTENIYSQKLVIKFGEKYYDNRELLGHFVTINGYKHFVSHTTGRLSPYYDHLLEELEEGKSKSDEFEFNGLKARGFWNFLKQSLKHE